MIDNLRKTGIELMSDIPWGTHICQFYKTKEDLLDILIPYFVTGLQNNEFCMWITSEPLGVEEAKTALKSSLKDLDEYIEKGQIEILDASEWYTPAGGFAANNVLEGWMEKEQEAIKNGFDGLRISGNTSWLEKKDWKKFMDYAGNVNHVINDYKIIGVCSYSLDKLNPSEIIDVVANHQISLIKREGKWELIESSEHKEAKDREIQNIQDFKYLSETAMGFIKLPPDADMYEYIAERLKKLVGNSIIIVNSFDSESDTTQVRAIKGFGKLTKSALKILGKDPIGSTYKINEIARHELLTGNYHKIPGKLNELSFGQMPKPICRALEKLFGIHEIHSMAFTWEDQLFGNVVIIRRDDIDLKNQKVIETFINQAAVALQRKQAEDALGESEDNYKRIFDNIHDMVIYVTKWGKIIDVNDRIEDVFGYKRNEVLGKNFMRLGAISLKDLPRTIKLFKHAAKIGKIEDTTGKGVNLNEFEIKRKNGEKAFIETSTRTLKKDGKTEGFLSIIRDITERKKAEEAIRQTDEKYRSIFERSLDGIYIHDFDGNFLDANDAALNMLGYKREEIPTLAFSSIVDEDQLAKAFEGIKNLLDSDSTDKIYEFKLKRKDGEYIWVEVKSSLLFKDGEPQAIQGIARDITERKKAEKKIVLQNEFLNSVLESLTHPFYVINANDYSIELANSAALNGDLKEGDTCYSMTHHENKPCNSSDHPCTMDQVKKTKKPVILEHIHYNKEGNPRNIEVHAYPIFNNKGKVEKIIEYSIDVTDRRNAEENLHFQAMLLNKSSEYIIASDLQGTLTFANEAIANLLGSKPKELIGKTVNMFPDEPGEISNLEIIQKAIADGHWKGERAINRADGGKGVIDLHIQLLNDEKGKPSSIFAIGRDITEKKNAEEALRIASNQWNSTFKAINDSVSLTDLNGKILQCNETMSKLVGKPSKEIIGKHCWQVIHGTSKPIKGCPVLRMKKSHKRETMELSLGDRSYNVIVDPVLDDKDNLVGIVHIISDITDRKRTEEALRESEEKYRNLIESSFDMVQSIDSNGNFIFVNKAWHNTMGYNEKEIKEINLFDIIHPESKTHCKELFSNVIAGKPQKNIEATFVTKDGKKILVEGNAKPRFFGDKILATQGFFRDVTQRKQAEEALKNRLQFEHIISKISTEMINSSSEQVDGIINKVLKDIAQFAGAVRGSLFILSKDGSTITNTHEWCLDQKDSQSSLLQEIPTEKFGYYLRLLRKFETVMVCDTDDIPSEAQEELKWVKKYGFRPLLFVPMVHEGRLYGTVGFYGLVGEIRNWPQETTSQLNILADILINAIERKRAAKALQESQRQLRIRNQLNKIFLTMPDNRMYSKVLEIVLITLKSEFGTFGYFNSNGSFETPAITREIFWNKCQITDKEIIFEIGEFGGIWAEAVKKKKTLYTNEGPFSIPKGHVPISNTIVTPVIYRNKVISAIHLANKPGGYNEKDKEMLETIADHIAPVLYARLERDKREKQRKVAEDALMESEEQFRVMFESSHDLISIVDRNGNTIIANPTWERILGYTPKTHGDPIDKIHPDDRKRVVDKWQVRDKGEVEFVDVQYRYKTAYGDYVYLEATVNDLEVKGRDLVSIVAHDITEKKNAEIVLIQSKKLASVGQLAAGVAHELNNPLANISLITANMSKMTNNPELLKKLNSLSNQGKMATKIVQSLLNFSRKIEPNFRRIGLNKTILECISESSQRKPKSIEIIESLNRHIPLIRADSDQIKQVFTNIIDNAYDAMPKGGKLIIESEQVDDEFASITITDTGEGLSKEDKEKIFDPFFTKKEVGKGVGLGLSICHGIITAHKGKIEVESEKGKGTTFTIKIPVG